MTRQQVTHKRRLNALAPNPHGGRQRGCRRSQLSLPCCQFFALLVQALIEREIRAAMKAANTHAIPLYPELRDCPAPSAARILEIFAGASRHMLRDANGQVLKVFEPELDPLQEQVLELLAISPAAFTLVGTPRP